MSAQQQPPVGMEGAVYLADAWRFVGRGKWWILLGAFLAVVIAAIVVFTAPTVYRSSALLTVVSERPSAEFPPPMLSSDGVLRLLKARPVIADTFRRAEDSAPGVSVQSSRLTPSLLSSRRGEVGNASLLELSVESPNPEQAEALANTWAEVYLEIDLRLSRIQAMRTSYHELLTEEQKVAEKFETARLKLAAVEKRLPEIPRTLNLKSRPTDRELLAGGSAQALISEEPNPLYTQLTAETIALSGEISGHEQTINRIRAAQQALKERLAEIAVAVSGDQVPPALMIEPVPGAPLPEYGSAQVLSRAVAPRNPEPNYALAKILLAAVGGAILGLLIAALSEAVRLLPEPAVSPQVARN